MKIKFIRKFLPIRVFSIKFGYGWWFGKYFFFFGKHATAFAILPMYSHLHQTTYENGKSLEDGMCHSWCEERQSEVLEDKRRKEAEK